MKLLSKLSFLVLLVSCQTTQEAVRIPANDSVQLENPSDGMYEAILSNRSFKSLEVKVLNKQSNEVIRGFGLGRRGNAEILVEEDAILVLTNDGDQTVKVEVDYRSTSPEQWTRSPLAISFTLANNSAKSIPLVIPGVMNPNLSPFSKSGVDLQIGQEIYFKKKGKNRLLLVVDESIANGDIIDVGKLVKKRMKDLDI